MLPQKTESAGLLIPAFTQWTDYCSIITVTCMYVNVSPMYDIVYVWVCGDNKLFCLINYCCVSIFCSSKACSSRNSWSFFIQISVTSRRNPHSGCGNWSSRWRWGSGCNNYWLLLCNIWSKSNSGKGKSCSCDCLSKWSFLLWLYSTRGKSMLSWLLVVIILAQKCSWGMVYFVPCFSFE